MYFLIKDICLVLFKTNSPPSILYNEVRWSLRVETQTQRLPTPIEFCISTKPQETSKTVKDPVNDHLCRSHLRERRQRIKIY